MRLARLVRLVRLLRLGGRAPIAATLLAALLAGCGGARPSRTPLGWGPLQPPVQGSSAPEGEARAARRPSRPKAHAEKGAQDAGATSKVGEAPSATGATVPEPKPNGASPSDGKPKAPGPEKSADWAGDYRGEDVALYRLRGIPDRTEKDPNARTTVKAKSAGALGFVLVDSSNGNEICTLDAELKDGRATIGVGQHCFDQNGAGASLTASVTSGFATLDGSRLHLEVQLDVEMEVAELEAKGTLEYRFDGTRK